MRFRHSGGPWKCHTLHRRPGRSNAPACPYSAASTCAHEKPYPQTTISPTTGGARMERKSAYSPVNKQSEHVYEQTTCTRSFAFAANHLLGKTKVVKQTHAGGHRVPESTKRQPHGNPQLHHVINLKERRIGTIRTSAGHQKCIINVPSGYNQVPIITKTNL